MLSLELENRLPTEPERLMEAGFEVVRKAFVKKRDILVSEVARVKQESSSRAQVRNSSAEAFCSCRLKIPACIMSRA